MRMARSRRRRAGLGMMVSGSKGCTRRPSTWACLRGCPAIACRTQRSRRVALGAPANAAATCNGTTCDFTCNTDYVRSGPTCVLLCTRGNCVLGNYCAASGLCEPGCETSAGCGFTSVCNTTAHACVATIIPRSTTTPSCPTGYVGGTTCFATGSFWCRYGGETDVMAGLRRAPTIVRRAPASTGSTTARTTVRHQVGFSTSVSPTDGR